MDPDPQDNVQLGETESRTVEQQRASEDTPPVQDALSQATPLEEGEIDEPQDTTVRQTQKRGREDDDTPLPDSKKDQNRLTQPHGYKAEVEQQRRIVNMRNTMTDAEKKARIIAALKGPNGMAIVQLTAPLIGVIEQGTDMDISIRATQAGKQEDIFQLEARTRKARVTIHKHIGQEQPAPTSFLHAPRIHHGQMSKELPPEITAYNANRITSVNFTSKELLVEARVILLSDSTLNSFGPNQLLAVTTQQLVIPGATMSILLQLAGQIFGPWRAKAHTLVIVGGTNDIIKGKAFPRQGGTVDKDAMRRNTDKLIDMVTRTLQQPGYRNKLPGGEHKPKGTTVWAPPTLRKTRGAQRKFSDGKKRDIVEVYNEVVGTIGDRARTQANWPTTVQVIQTQDQFRTRAWDDIIHPATSSVPIHILLIERMHQSAQEDTEEPWLCHAPAAISNWVIAETAHEHAFGTNTEDLTNPGTTADRQKLRTRQNTADRVESAVLGENMATKENQLSRMRGQLPFNIPLLMEKDTLVQQEFDRLWGQAEESIQTQSKEKNELRPCKMIKTFRREPSQPSNKISVIISELQERTKDNPEQYQKYLATATGTLSNTFKDNPLSFMDTVMELFATGEWGNMKTKTKSKNKAWTYAYDIRPNELIALYAIFGSQTMDEGLPTIQEIMEIPPEDKRWQFMALNITKTTMNTISLQETTSRDKVEKSQIMDYWEKARDRIKVQWMILQIREGRTVTVGEVAKRLGVNPNVMYNFMDSRTMKVFMGHEEQQMQGVPTQWFKDNKQMWDPTTHVEAQLYKPEDVGEITPSNIHPPALKWTEGYPSRLTRKELTMRLESQAHRVRGIPKKRWYAMETMMCNIQEEERMPMTVAPDPAEQTRKQMQQLVLQNDTQQPTFAQGQDQQLTQMDEETLDDEAREEEDQEMDDIPDSAFPEEGDGTTADWLITPLRWGDDTKICDVKPTPKEEADRPRQYVMSIRAKERNGHRGALWKATNNRANQAVTDDLPLFRTDEPARTTYTCLHCARSTDKQCTCDWTNQHGSILVKGQAPEVDRITTALNQSTDPYDATTLLLARMMDGDSWVEIHGLTRYILIMDTWLVRPDMEDGQVRRAIEEITAGDEERPTPTFLVPTGMTIFQVEGRKTEPVLSRTFCIPRTLHPSMGDGDSQAAWTRAASRLQKNTSDDERIAGQLQLFQDPLFTHGFFTGSRQDRQALQRMDQAMLTPELQIIPYSRKDSGRKVETLVDRSSHRCVTQATTVFRRWTSEAKGQKALITFKGQELSLAMTSSFMQDELLIPVELTSMMEFHLALQHPGALSSSVEAHRGIRGWITNLDPQKTPDYTLLDCWATITVAGDVVKERQRRLMNDHRQKARCVFSIHAALLAMRARWDAEWNRHTTLKLDARGYRYLLARTLDDQNAITVEDTLYGSRLQQVRRGRLCGRCTHK